MSTVDCVCGRNIRGVGVAAIERMSQSLSPVVSDCELVFNTRRGTAGLIDVNIVIFLAEHPLTYG